ncbi:MAG: hypothetical protein ACNA75_08330 [Thiohalomonadaceae bacterium]
MADDHFQVILTGAVAEGAELAQVKANVAALFKVGLDKVDRLFGAQPVAIKKGLDEATARKYQQALQRAGAVALVQDTAPAAAPSQHSAAESAAGTADPGTAPEQADRIPSIDSGLHKSVIKAAPQGLGELEKAELDAPGTILVEPEAVSAPQVDTSGLQMAEPGVVLVAAEPVPELQLDLSGLSLDEPGVTLTEAKDEPPLELDLEGLSMDEPGTVLVESEENPEPEIDTSKLKLEP